MVIPAVLQKCILKGYMKVILGLKILREIVYRVQMKQDIEETEKACCISLKYRPNHAEEFMLKILAC